MKIPHGPPFMQRGENAVECAVHTLRLFVVLAAALIVCQGCSQTGQKSLPPLKIGINVWPGYAHAFVAQEKGFFKKYGADVELVLRENISDVTELYKNGELDGLFQVFPDIIMLNASGFPTKVVYVADESVKSDVIIGRPDLGGISSLSGKTVSFEGINSFSHIFVLKVLQKAGIAEYEVNFTNVPAMDVLEALEKGRIDAAHTWEPVTTRALKKGYAILARAADAPGVITDVLGFKNEVVSRRPLAVQAVVSGMLDARAFLEAHPEEALAIMSGAEDIDPGKLRSGLAGVRQPGRNGNMRLLFDTGASLYRAGDHIIDFYYNRGQLIHSPELSAVLEPRFIMNAGRADR